MVSVECEPDLAMNSYPGPYGQVLTNLVINSAVHAFPDGAREPSISRHRRRASTTSKCCFQTTAAA